ncbi:hypothetical protein AOLI_G00038260 [Acnodon oligacanthus]
MENAYGPASEHAAAVAIELRQRTHKPDETLHTLRDDIYEKVFIAYANRSAAEQDVIGVEIFTNAIQDVGIIQRLLEERPHKLAKAYEIAYRFEATRRTAASLIQFRSTKSWHIPEHRSRTAMVCDGAVLREEEDRNSMSEVVAEQSYVNHKFQPAQHKFKGGEMRVRQPLMTLLVLTVFSTSAFQLSLILHLSLQFMAVSWNFKHAVEALMFYAVRVSIPTNLWLRIFYCSHIVPVKKAPLIWLKKNIKVTMYFLLISTKIYFLVYLVLEFLMAYGIFSTQNSPEVNNTIVNGSVAPIWPTFQLSQFLDTLDTLTMLMALLSLSVMLTVTGATGRYLYKHVKKMTKSGTPFQSQLLQNQVRVTITSLVQGFLYLLCSAGIFIDVYCAYQKVIFDRDIIWMLFDLYSLATTLNLGVGQTLLRQRVAQLCQKAGH